MRAQVTQNELAITYNDVSILEHHHVATAFRLLHSEGCDWTPALNEEQYRDFRESVITMVLGTDMKVRCDVHTANVNMRLFLGVISTDSC